MVYLLFSNDLGVGTADRLVSTVQTENPDLLLCSEQIEKCPFLLCPSWLTVLQTFLC